MYGCLLRGGQRQSLWGEEEEGQMRDSQTVELDVLASWLIRSYDFDM
jgi:hypothetical protein